MHPLRGVSFGMKSGLTARTCSGADFLSSQFGRRGAPPRGEADAGSALGLFKMPVDLFVKLNGGVVAHFFLAVVHGGGL